MGGRDVDASRRLFLSELWFRLRRNEARLTGKPELAVLLPVVFGFGLGVLAVLEIDCGKLCLDLQAGQTGFVQGLCLFDTLFALALEDRVSAFPQGLLSAAFPGAPVAEDAIQGCGDGIFLGSLSEKAQFDGVRALDGPAALGEIFDGGLFSRGLRLVHLDEFVEESLIGSWLFARQQDVALDGEPVFARVLRGDGFALCCARSRGMLGVLLICG